MQTGNINNAFLHKWRFCFLALIGMWAFNLAQAAWIDGFAYRKSITIDHAKIDAELTNFPVLVRFTTNNFDFGKSLTNGFDIQFTAADTTTLLSYERERHGSKPTIIRVMIPC